MDVLCAGERAVAPPPPLRPSSIAHMEVGLDAGRDPSATKRVHCTPDDGETDVASGAQSAHYEPSARLDAQEAKPQALMPHEADASYVMLLSELAAPHARPVAEKAASFASTFVHTPPPTAIEASSHPDAVSVRAALAALMVMARCLKVASRTYGGAAVRRSVERYLLGLLQSKTLGAGTDNVEDKVLRAQLETLSFLRPAHLGVDLSLTQGSHWTAAQACLLCMSAYSYPDDKMACAAACHAHLRTLLDPHDASFLKLLALCMLACRPPQLHSQLEYAHYCTWIWL